MIDRVVRVGTVVARSDGSQHAVFPVAASPAEGEALRGWIVREGATRTIEIGLGYGVSALYACDGILQNGGGTHVAIDPHQATRFAGCGLQLLDEAGVRHVVEHHAEESQTALPRLLGEGCRFDLAFVDGNHASSTSSSTSPISAGSCGPEGSSFWTITSCPRSSARPRSSCATSAGPSRRCHRPTSSTSGPSCAPRASRTSGRTTTTSTSEAPRGPATPAQPPPRPPGRP